MRNNIEFIENVSVESAHVGKNCVVNPFEIIRRSAFSRSLEGRNFERKNLMIVLKNKKSLPGRP